MAYSIKKTEPGLWTLGETFESNGKEYWEALEDFSVEAEAQSELHRCIYGTPLIPDESDGPTVEDRLKALEAQVEAQARQLKALTNKLNRLFRYTEDMPGGADLD